MFGGRTDGFQVMVLLYLRGQTADNDETKFGTQGNGRVMQGGQTDIKEVYI